MFFFPPTVDRSISANSRSGLLIALIALPIFGQGNGNHVNRHRRKSLIQGKSFSFRPACRRNHPVKLRALIRRDHSNYRLQRFVHICRTFTG